MLSADFIDWWFSPWRYAVDAVPVAAPDDLISQRDGYRTWCEEVGIDRALPQHFDPLWSSAALRDARQLEHAASLFMGLIAARQPLQTHQTTLNMLSFDDRKWCLSLAATQLLPAYSVDHPDSDDACAVRGMAELAIRLNAGFPGVWPRLQMTLPAPDRASVQLRMQNNWADRDAVTRTAVRSQRCWRLCLQRGGGAA